MYDSEIKILIYKVDEDSVIFLFLLTCFVSYM